MIVFDVGTRGVSVCFMASKAALKVPFLKIICNFKTFEDVLSCLPLLLHDCIWLLYSRLSSSITRMWAPLFTAHPFSPNVGVRLVRMCTADFLSKELFCVCLGSRNDIINYHRGVECDLWVGPLKCLHTPNHQSGGASHAGTTGLSLKSWHRHKYVL